MNDVSNLAPAFDEIAIRRLIARYDDLLSHMRTTVSGPIHRQLTEHVTMLTNAIDAHDALRERCLMAEARERALVISLRRAREEFAAIREELTP